MSNENDDIAVNCSVLSNPDEQQICVDLKEVMDNGDIDLTEFSEGLFKALDKDEDKLMSVFLEDEKEAE